MAAIAVTISEHIWRVVFDVEENIFKWFYTVLQILVIRDQHNLNSSGEEIQGNADGQPALRPVVLQWM